MDENTPYHCRMYYEVLIFENINGIGMLDKKEIALDVTFESFVVFDSYKQGHSDKMTEEMTLFLKKKFTQIDNIQLSWIKSYPDDFKCVLNLNLLDIIEPTPSFDLILF